MSSWIKAKKVFQTAISGDRKWPMWVMRELTNRRLPLALGRMNVS